MSKKILYIGGFELPDKNAAAQRVVANAKLFTALGYEVKLVGLSNKDYNKQFEYEGLDCINLKYPNSSINWFKYIMSVSTYLNIIDEFQPIIVIAYNHPAVALKRLYCYGKKHGIKVLSDCTEWYKGKGSFIHKIIKDWDISYRMNKVQCQIDGIIVISKYLEDFYKKKNVANILRLPPLTDMSNPKWEKARRSIEKYDEIRLIYAGNPGKKDRLDYIIDALSSIVQKHHINLNFTIVGKNKDEVTSIYNYKKEIPEFVHFLGRLPHEEVLYNLANSDFQVFIRENNRITTAGFPTKFVEAISSGILVLTNPTSDINTFLHAGVNGFLIDTTSEETIHSSLFKVLSLKRNEVDALKAKLDRTQFDYHKFIDKTEAFFSGIN